MLRRLPEGLLLSLVLLPAAHAQFNSTSTAGCLRLLGSVACEGFEGAYIHPQNLSQAFPWMSTVTNVAEFDTAALEYFSDPAQYARTQFVTKLGCSNATGVTLRYARTVLCSMWTNGVRSQQCNSLLDQSTLLNSPRMVCQETCQEYAASETALVNDATYCPGPDLTGGFRAGNITKDFVQCTNWTTLATNETSVCVLGSANEANCGYGSSVSQLCDFCNPSSGTPDSCCYSATTVGTSCSYTLAALPANATSSSASAASSSSSSSSTAIDGLASTAQRGLSGGAIAGIVIGSLVALLLLLLLLLLLCRRRRDHPTADAASPTLHSGSTAPSASSTFVSRFFGTGAVKPGKGGNPPEHNDKSQMMAGIGLGVTAGAAVGDRDAPVGAHDGMVHAGEVVTVLWPYASTLSDELDLRPGMKIRIVQLYDDAWATGELVAGPQSGRQGAFPLVCVTLNGASSSNGGGGGDTSSLAPSRASSDAHSSYRRASLNAFESTELKSTGGRPMIPSRPESPASSWGMGRR